METAAAAATANAEANKKILSSLASLTAASTSTSSLPDLSFSPIKQVINESSLKVIRRIETFEDARLRELEAKVAKLEVENSQLRTELSTTKIDAASDKRLLAEKEKQCEHLNTRMNILIDRLIKG